MCGLLIEVEDNAVKSIRGDPQDPMSRGHICPKAIALDEIQRDPDRLRTPRRRTPDGWVEISWNEALDETADRIAELQRTHGDDAFAVYLGNPAAHNFGLMMYLAMLYSALGTRNHYSASSLDQNPKHASSLFLFGNFLNIPVPDIDRTDYLLILGANPAVSNGSLFTAPGFRKRARDLQRRGGRIVVIDPRRTETAKLADEHIFIPPGRDALLLAAIAHTIIAERRQRKCSANARAWGVNALELALRPFAAEVVAPLISIDALTIHRLVREFTSVNAAVCYGRFGTTMTSFGTLNSWLIDVINLLTGNLDRAGGAMFPTPAVDLAGLQRMRGRTGSHAESFSRVRGAVEFNGEFPTACLAEEIATPGPGQVRGLITVAGNPVISAPNAGALDQAISGLDFHVAIDFYINETSRHADIILPPTWSLEHDNYEALFHGFAIRNTTKYSPRVITPDDGALDDWQISSGLALRLFERKASNFLARMFYRALRHSRWLPAPRRLLGWLLRIGPHGDSFVPWRPGLRLRDLEAQPEGLDLGPLIPDLDRILSKPDEKIALDHPIMMNELARLAEELKAGATTSDDSLLLIGRRGSLTNNSWLGNTRVASRPGDTCTLLVHPTDAARLAIREGDRVRITSRTGAIEAPVSVSDEMMPGVVSLPHGWGHALPGVEMHTATSVPGVNCNELTDDQPLEGVVGNAILNGVPVSLEPVTQ